MMIRFCMIYLFAGLLSLAACAPKMAVVPHSLNNVPQQSADTMRVQIKPISVPSIKKPDFQAIASVKKRKQVFFDWLSPIVNAENARVLAQRKQLLSWNVKKMTAKQRAAFTQLKQQYAVDERDDTKAIDELSLRVDAMPASLALVQAANESAWGTSRFARKGNNLFGQWCYQKGCGMVPQRRDKGAVHEVAVFDDAADAVRAYLFNLNTSKAYQKMRKIRRGLKRMGKEPIAEVLVVGMEAYSERGEHYIRDLRHMLESNRELLDRQS